MKKYLFENLPDKQTNDSGHQNKNLEDSSKNFLEGNSGDILKDLNDLPTPKNKGSGQLENIVGGSSYEQVKLEIVDLFLDIKHVILQEEDHEIMLLLKTIPLDAEEEELLELEPLLLLEFIRQLFMKTAKMKADVQLEMEEKKEFGCAEYEPQLQKLEADIREHIKIEQQMKLYAESLQEKLDDYEQGKRPKGKSDDDLMNQIEKMTETIKELQAANAEKDQEIENLRKELRAAIDAKQVLELQVELVPILKEKIKELQGVAQFTQRSSGRPKSANKYLPNLSRDHQSPGRLEGDEDEKNGYFDQNAHLKFKNPVSKKSSQKSFRNERTPDPHRRDESRHAETQRVLSSKNTKIHTVRLAEKSLNSTGRVVKRSPSNQRESRLTFKDDHPEVDINHEVKRPVRVSGSKSPDRPGSTIRQSRESSSRKLKRSVSRDQEFLENHYKLQGKVTHEQLMETYGKALGYKSISNLKERVSRRRGSIVNKENMNQLLKPNANQNEESARVKVSSPNKTEGRSRSVGALNGNHRTLRSKQNLHDEVEIQQISELLKENTRSRRF